MNESSTVDQMEITTKVYAEAMRRADTLKKDQILWIWNVSADSYYFEITGVDEPEPKHIDGPYITRYFTHKEKPHE